MLKPQATGTRDLVNLDGVWRFALDQSAPRLGPERSPDPSRRPCPRATTTSSSTRRSATTSAWSGTSARCRCRAAGRGSGSCSASMPPPTPVTVYVNDTLVATHVGGYTPFEADLTGIVEPGTAFRLTIGVDNRLTNITIPPGHGRRPAPTARRSRPTGTTSTTTRASPARCGCTPPRSRTSPTSP